MCRFTTSDWKNCATCRFWTGPRELNDLHTAAETEATSFGDCTLDEKHRRHYATNSCIRWRAWTAIA